MHIYKMLMYELFIKLWKIQNIEVLILHTNNADVCTIYAIPYHYYVMQCGAVGCDTLSINR